LQQVRDQRGRLHDLLEVVQHQQELLLAEVALELHYDLLVPRHLYPEGGCDPCSHELRRAERSEIDEPHAVGKFVKQLSRDLERQAGLADATRTGQGHQAHRGLAQLLPDCCDLLLAPDQGRGRKGQRL
jgi:hypothetical protein